MARFLLLIRGPTRPLCGPSNVVLTLGLVLLACYHRSCFRRRCSREMAKVRAPFPSIDRVVMTTSAHIVTM